VTIRSRPSNEAFREGWERVFGKAPPKWRYCSDCGGEYTGRTCTHGVLNPHDALDHPEAD
jgi:hypothetical protein